MKPSGRFSGWTAVVTGASSGLGAEFARQLAPRLGAGRLILVARRTERLQALATEISGRLPGLILHIETADLGDPAAVGALVSRLAVEGIEPDLLVNNAGLGDMGTFADAPPERIEEILRVNVEALTRLIRAWLPGMMARRRGAVVNVGSVAGYLPLPTFAVYAATKAYVNSFSEALHWELRGTNVTVTAACPGPVPTEFSSVARREGSRRSLNSPSFVRIGAEQAVAEALRAVEKGKPRVVPGVAMRFFTAFIGKLPLWFLRIAYRFGAGGTSVVPEKP